MKKNKTAKQSSKARKTLKIFLITLLIGIFSIASYIGYEYVSYQLRTRYTLNHELGSIARSVVNNAQYLPDSDLIFGYNNSYSVENSPRLSTSQFPDEIWDIINGGNREIDYDVDQESFNEIIDQIGNIGDYGGAGKYLGYSIYELRYELNYLLKYFPIFDQWFQMPHNYYIPHKTMNYMGNYSYKITSNEDTSHLTINRVCWTTRASYYDSSRDMIIEDNDGLYFDKNGKPKFKKVHLNNKTYQREIMQIDYYFENGKEVVECKIYDVLMINNDDYPIAFEYIKNVKDTSLTNYKILFRDRLGTRTFYGTKDTEDYGYAAGKGPYSDDGYDIDSNVETGIEREFLQLNYTNSNDISILRVNQTNESLYDTNPKGTTFMFFNKSIDGISCYSSSYTYRNGVTKKDVTFNLETLSRYKNSIAKVLIFGEGNAHRYSASYNYAKTIIRNLSFSSADAIQAKDYFLLSNYAENIQDAEVSNKLLLSLRALGEYNNASNNTIDYLNSCSPTLSSEYNDFQYETFVDVYLEKVTKDLIKNFDLDKEWKDSIINDIKKCKYVEYSQELFQNDYKVDFKYGYYQGEDYSYQTLIYCDMDEKGLYEYNGFLCYKFNDPTINSEDVRMSFLLKEVDGDYFKEICIVNNNLIINSDNEWDCQDISENYINFNTFSLDRQGRYYIALGVMQDVNGVAVQISEDIEIDFRRISGYFGREAEFINGFRYKYYFTDEFLRLNIEVKVFDVEAPTILVDNTNIELSENETFQDILDKITIADNDYVASVDILDSENISQDLTAQAYFGTYTIVATDNAGNYSTIIIILH